MHDPTGRRGIWFCVVDGVLHVRGGREGHDAHAAVEASRLDPKMFNQLVSALSYGAWMQEEYGPNDDSITFWHGDAEALADKMGEQA